MRQQSERPVVNGVRRPNRCLSDFIAPKSSGVADYIGLFAVTAGIGVDKKEAQFEADHDDYSAIMLKALADRFAEAFAECLHQRVRTDLWGYDAAEHLSNDDLIAEKYRGIRPAPGYPACPEHTVKGPMFEFLDCAEIGMGITESLAMTPAASVSGFYLSHPDSTYFTIGKIGQDQLDDMAARRHEDRDAVARGRWPPTCNRMRRRGAAVVRRPFWRRSLMQQGNSPCIAAWPRCVRRHRRLTTPYTALQSLTDEGRGATIDWLQVHVNNSVNAAANVSQRITLKGAFHEETADLPVRPVDRCCFVAGHGARHRHYHGQFGRQGRCRCRRECSGAGRGRTRGRRRIDVA